MNGKTSFRIYMVFIRKEGYGGSSPHPGATQTTTKKRTDDTRI